MAAMAGTAVSIIIILIVIIVLWTIGAFASRYGSHDAIYVHGKRLFLVIIVEIAVAIVLAQLVIGADVGHHHHRHYNLI